MEKSKELHTASPEYSDYIEADSLKYLSVDEIKEAAHGEVSGFMCSWH